MLVLLLPHAVLLATAGLCSLLAFRPATARAAGVVCLLGLIGAVAALAMVVHRGDGGEHPADAALVWDPWAVAFAWGGLAMAGLFALAAQETARLGGAAAMAFGLWLVSVAGGLLAIAAHDLILLIAGWELMLLPLSLLPVLSGRDTGTGAARRHLLLGLLAALLLAYGLGMLYGLGGTTRLPALREILSSSYVPDDPQWAVGEPSRLGVVGLVLVLAGLGARMGVVPFQFGLPETARQTTAWQAGVWTVWPKVVGTLVLLRLLPGTLVGYETTGLLVFGLLAGLTLAGGAMAALVETNVRRLLAWVGIAELGSVLLGLAVACAERGSPSGGLPAGTVSAVFALVAAMVPLTGLFLVLTYLERPRQPVEFVGDLAGLVRREPVAAGCAAMFLVSLAGLPPFPGFWQRLWLLAAALSVPGEGGEVVGPHSGFLVLVGVALASWLLLAAAALRLAAILVLHPQIARPQPARGQAALAAAVLAAFVTAGIGLLPGPLVGYLDRLDVW